MEYYSKPTLVSDDIAVFPLSWNDFDSIDEESRSDVSPFLDIPWNLSDFFWWEVDKKENSILIDYREVEVILINANSLKLPDCSVSFKDYERYISFKGCGELWFSTGLRKYIKRTLNFWKDDSSNIKVNIILTSIKFGVSEQYESYNFEIKAFNKDGSELILNSEYSINKEITDSTEITAHYSWTQLSNKMIKTLDYSAFNARSSGIPRGIHSFFDFDYDHKMDIPLTLKYGDNFYGASITWKGKNHGRAVMIWGNGLSGLLKQKFPKWESIKPHDKDSEMGLVFSKFGSKNTYQISFEGDKPEMTFGHIEGVSDGQVFTNRIELGLSGIHTPTQAGIWGKQSEGSASIVLSGGYEDDVDEGDYILYTGQGGRDAESGKQIKDQEFTRGNKGLQLNKEYNRPVRVTRGYQVEHGPDEGYRYDGLYYVTDYERVKGKEGFFVCRFHLQKEEGSIINDDIEHPVSPSERVHYSGNRVKRNVSFAEQIKDLYGNTCQVCQVFLKTPTEGEGISEAAHIKALGKPHNGPDTKANMICLCPNHHAQFDRYSFYIEPDTLEIIGLDEFKGQSITIDKKHKVKVEFFEYQKQQYLRKN